MKNENNQIQRLMVDDTKMNKLYKSNDNFKWFRINFKDKNTKYKHLKE